MKEGRDPRLGIEGGIISSHESNGRRMKLVGDPSIPSQSPESPTPTQPPLPWGGSSIIQLEHKLCVKSHTYLTT